MQRKEKAVLKAIKGALARDGNARATIMPNGVSGSIMNITGKLKGSGTKVTVQTNFGPKRIDNCGPVNLAFAQFAATMPEAWTRGQCGHNVRLFAGGLEASVAEKPSVEAVPSALWGSDPILVRFPAVSLKPLVCFKPDLTRKAASVVHLNADGPHDMVAVATNGHILAKVPILMGRSGTKAKKVATECTIPIPVMQLAGEIVRILDHGKGIEMFIGDKTATMALGGVNISFGLRESPSLPWRRMMPEKSTASVEVPAKQVLKGLAKLAKVVGKAEPVSLEAAHATGRLVHLLGPGEEGTSVIIEDVFGTVVIEEAFGLQLQYWQQVMKSFSGAVRITLSTTSGQPMTFSSTDDDVEIIVAQKRAQ